MKIRPALFELFHAYGETAQSPWRSSGLQTRPSERRKQTISPKRLIWKVSGPRLT